MATEEEKFVAASDAADEYAEELIASLEQQSLEDIDDLINHTDNRDFELWEELGLDPNLVVEDYEQENERDLDWSLGLAGIFAAASLQFFLDNRQKTIIEPVLSRIDATDGYKIEAEKLKIASKRESDVGAQKIKKSKVIPKRHSRTLSNLSNLSNLELYNELVDIGALSKFDTIVSNAVGSTSRMIAFPAGSPQFKEALSNTISANSRNLKSQNRRSVEAICVAMLIYGRSGQLMMWLIERDSNTCIFCRGNSNKIKTYAKWRLDGLPGAEVCLGGDLCRCHLVPI